MDISELYSVFIYAPSPKTPPQLASTHGDHTVKLVDVVRSLDELRAQVMVDSRGVESVPGMGNPAMLRVLRNNHLNSGGSGSSNAMMSDEALPPPFYPPP